MKNSRSWWFKIKLQEIWDEVYKENNREDLGWYESIPEPSLSLIKKYNKDFNEIIVDAGCGESTLIENLIASNYKNIIGIDISSSAIDFLKNNTSIVGSINFINQDLSEEINLNDKVALWHDRAVFHFLIDDTKRNVYKRNLINNLSKNGVFIIACFSDKNIATKCNGLPVKKYKFNELEDFFSDFFKLKEKIIHEYIMPHGDKREYIYCVFQKNN